jgi:osmotically-inducible protein OsmY
MCDYSMRAIVIASTLCLLMGSLVSPHQVAAQETTTESSAVSRQAESVQSSGGHHYQNDAERAKDDLLITEVKSDLAKDGVADEHPVAVDCDHGKIRLSGVVASAADARHAGDIAADASGVVAVANQLTWPK